jgi:hypothetical protein
VSRVPRLSVGFVRLRVRLGWVTGSPAMRGVLTTISGIASAEVLPGPADFETDFSPGRAYVRRVAGQNVWLLYRFDATHVDVLAVRNDPPVPTEPKG